MNDLITKIVAWANARNLIKGSDVDTQLLKLLSEVGELADAVTKNDLDGIKDAIGDCFVVLTIVCEMSRDVDIPNNYDDLHIVRVRKMVCSLGDVVAKMAHDVSNYRVKVFVNKLRAIAICYGFTLQECVQSAYDEIKDRRGYMKNGIFIKLSDMTSDDRNEYEKSINDRS